MTVMPCECKTITVMLTRHRFAAPRAASHETRAQQASTFQITPLLSTSLLLLSLCNSPRSMRAPHPRLLAAGAALLVFTAFVRLRIGRDAGSSWARMPEVMQPAPRADAGWAEFQSKLVEEVTAAKAKQVHTPYCSTHWLWLP